MTSLALSPRSWGQVVGANSDIRIAVVGLNGRGQNHLTSLDAIPGVRIAAICDVDTAVLKKVGQRKYLQRHAPKHYTDIRQLLGSPEIDAITIATPNHWHALGAIWACQAGKDVFVEKPVSHNVWEGRQLVAAAKRYNRVVQSGTQIRSGQGLIDAREWILAGNLGRITLARGFCYKRRESIGLTSGPTPVPETIDYDLWSGPAPIIPPHRNSARNGAVHYDWHWLWPYGNGDIGNQGIHQMDVARWFLNEPGLPRHTLSIGGRVGYRDDGETPNTQIIYHDYATAPLIFEVRGLPAKADSANATVDSKLSSAAAAGAATKTMDRYRGVGVGNVIECEGGSIVMPGYFDAVAYDRAGKEIRAFKGEDRLMANFIDVIRSRKTEELYGPIEDGHISSALCHLGNISHQLGRATSTEAIRDHIRNHALFTEACDRMQAHLAANEIDLTQTPLTLGAPLQFDSVRERFTGPLAASADALLTREYRAPYTVPQLAAVTA